MKRRIILISIGVVFIVLIGWQVVERIIKAGGKHGAQFMEMPVAVELEEVRKMTLTEYGNFTGSLVARSQFTVAPKVSGRLEKLLVDIGDRVRRNDLIALLDDEEYRQQVVQAEADLKVAQANLDESLSSLKVAEREAKRIEELHKRGIAADSELDSAKGVLSAQEAKYKVALAQVANREAALRAAQVRLSYTKIHATWTGGSEYRVVGERFVDEGDMLTANAPILSILEINPILAVIHVTDRDYFKVRVGEKAIVSSSAASGIEAQGKVIRIAPLLKESSREARVEIEISNPEELLKPGMFVNAKIEFETHEQATVIPLGTVVKRDSQEGVFLADIQNRKAKFIPIKIGIKTGELAEIVEPKQLSGFVITLGQHLVSDGSPIILPQKEGGILGSKPPALKNEVEKENKKLGEKK